MASISQSGAITTLSAGQTTIAATAGGKSGQTVLTVTALPVLTTLLVSGTASSIQVGQQTTVTASGRDQGGAAIATGTINWSSSSNAIANVNQSGVVTGVSTGTATITAAVGTITAQLAITVTPAPATRLSLTTPPPATSATRTSFPVAPTVQLLDANGASVAQAGVVITASLSGGGSLTGNSTATTGTNGAATFAGLGINGVVGSRVLTFSAPSLSSTSWTLALTQGAPASITINAGNAQTAFAGSEVALPPSVRVADADANPVANATVTFAIATGGGSVGGSTQVTNASGIATAGGWRLGTVGANTLTASVQGVPAPVTFTATATVAPLVCPSKGALTLGLRQFGATTVSSCIFREDNLTYGIRGAPYGGPNASGTFFVDRYTLDVPAGAIVRIDFSQISGRTLPAVVYTAAGAFVGYAYSTPSVTINNASGAVLSYQVLVGSIDAGVFGSYNLIPIRLN